MEKKGCGMEDYRVQRAYKRKEILKCIPTLFTLCTQLKLAGAENTSIGLVSVTINTFPFLNFTTFTNIFYYVILRGSEWGSGFKANV